MKMSLSLLSIVLLCQSKIEMKRVSVREICKILMRF